MAKTNNTEERRDMKVPVTCLTCEHAHLHRYDNNPVLAACRKKPQEGNERFPFEIEIASLLRLCKPYKKSRTTKEIEQRFKKAS